MDPRFQLLLASGVFATLVVFVGAFRFALRECAETRELACQPDIRARRFTAASAAG